MSSSAYLTFEKDTKGVSSESWIKFCDENRLTLVKKSGGIHRVGDVEAERNSAYFVSFSTYFKSDEMPKVASLALKAWKLWGGCFGASPEIVAIIADYFTATDEDK